jgi:hypothetical protein
LGAASAMFVCLFVCLFVFGMRCADPHDTTPIRTTTQKYIKWTGRTPALLPPLLPPAAVGKKEAAAAAAAAEAAAEGPLSLEALCPGCPPRPAANVLALLMRRHAVNLMAARALLAGLSREEAVALEAEVRAAKAEYAARLRAYCGRRGQQAAGGRPRPSSSAAAAAAAGAAAVRAVKVEAAGAMTRSKRKRTHAS